MSKEHANQQLRDNKGEPAGVAKVKEDEVKKLLRIHGDLSYVPIEDLKDLITNTARQLIPMANDSSAEYAYGVEAPVAMNILCAILRVPKASAPQGNEKKSKEANQKAVDAYRTNHLKAAAIAGVIHIDDTKNCSYEKFQEAMKNAGDEQAVKSILMRPKMDSAQLLLPNSEALPAFKPAPKSLSCTEKFKVKLNIQSVNPKDGEAIVKLVEVEDEENTTLVSLVGKDLTMTIGNRKKSIHKVLIATQLLEKSVQCTVGATLALRTRDFQHNKLSLINFTHEKNQQMEIAAGLQQMSFDF